MATAAAAPGTADRRRWIILGVLFLVRTSMGFQFQSVASTAPLLADALGIGYAEIGTLIGLYMLPGIVIALPGGLLGQRFGDRTICAAGLVLMIVGGALLAASGGEITAAAGRLVAGTGAVLFSLVITKMVADWFAGGEIVTAMAVILASWPCGIAVGLVSQGALAAAVDWRAVMLATALLCAAALALVLALYRAPPAPVGEAAPAPLVFVLSRREIAAVSVSGLMWGLFNVGFVLFISFAPTLLVERGAPLAEAGALASIALWVTMLSVPLSGYVTERIGRPDAAIVLFAGAAGLLLLAFPFAPMPALVCALFGFAIGPPAGAIMALPARALRPASRAVGLGLFFTVYYAAMTAGPPIAGALRDLAGSAAAALAFGAATFLAVPPVLALFHALRLAGLAGDGSLAAGEAAHTPR